MIRKLLFALAALISAPLSAQSYDGGGAVTPDWTDLTPTMPTGTAPADAIEPADVADSGFTATDWWVANDGTTGYLTSGGAEKKFRLLCEPVKTGAFDSILYYGVTPPVGHDHTFIGNAAVNENTTWTTLRATPGSTCAGGPLMAQIYWAPSMKKALANGRVVTVRPQRLSVYYIAGMVGDANDRTWLRRNHGMIFGANPNDYNDTAKRAEYTGAANGYGGWEYPGSPETPAGFHGFRCTISGVEQTVTRTASRMLGTSGTASTVSARHLNASPTGSTADTATDPWGGNCVGTVGAPAMIAVDLQSPECWDRTNLRATDGRGHMRHATRTSDNAYSGKCPNNWSKVPRLETREFFYTTGWADYGSWYLSSDRMNTFATAGDPTSKDPCRQVSGWFCPGSTAHADVIFGQQGAIFKEMQRECLGIPVDGVAPTYGPAECDGGVVSKFKLLRDSGASPNTTLSGGCATLGDPCTNAVPGNVQRYFPVTASTPATVTIGHVH